MPYTPHHVNLNFSENFKNLLYTALNSVLKQLETDSLDGRHLLVINRDLTLSVLQSVQRAIQPPNDDSAPRTEAQLINCYPLQNQKYDLTLAWMSMTDDLPATPRILLNLIAEERDNRVYFTLPLTHLTRYWKTNTIGNVQYIYRDEIRLDRADLFDSNNSAIAKKFGRTPDSFKYYMCENFQEILLLLGLRYDSEANGQFRDGYGVDAGCIFSIMNNEDFSHDVFHYYSEKVNDGANRNWIVEEGFAYAWGNAYYTDSAGEMITQTALVDELRIYIKRNPSTSLLELFENQPKIFNHLAPEISIRSVISGIICSEVEKRRGMEGVLTLINCGRKDSQMDFFRAIHELIGVDKSNFDEKVMRLMRSN